MAPAVLEDRLRSHAADQPVHGRRGRQPFVAALITLDPEALGPWEEGTASRPTPRSRRCATTRSWSPTCRRAVDDANQAVSRAESISKFRILDADFTQEAGQLTVKLGIRRSVLLKDFAADIDALYS